jgi:hypothetical protein
MARLRISSSMRRDSTSEASRHPAETAKKVALLLVLCHRPAHTAAKFDDRLKPGGGKWEAPANPGSS